MLDKKNTFVKKNIPCNDKIILTMTDIAQCTKKVSA